MPGTTHGSDPCDLAAVNEPAVAQVLDEQASGEDLERLAAIFQMLASPSRLRIVEALSGRELCVCDLARVAGVSPSAVSHHLRQLRELRVVRFRRAGRMAYYSLNHDRISHLFRAGLEHVRR